MSINQKIVISNESTWLSEHLTPDERKVAEYISLIASAIQRQRKAKGYTQQELARMIGVSQVMVSRWENGEENFTIATLAKISTALEISLHNPFDNFAEHSMVAQGRDKYST